MNNILTAKNLTIQRGGQPIFCVDEFAVREGEILALIGPNGVGKSTLLLTLAQIIKPITGDLKFNNRTLNFNKTLAYRRSIAVMLQDPLMLHCSVFDNIAIGLRFRGLSKKQIETRVMHWLSRLGIRNLRHRSAQRISGGEAQRVSMARSMVLDPEILFLDEPFRALDAPTRARLMADFRAIQSDGDTTTILVTHDLDEALLLADRVAIILEGGLRQCDSPEMVYSSPSDADVADFVGVETILPGCVNSVNAGHVTVAVDGFFLDAISTAEFNQQVLLCIRPEDITLWVANDLPQSSARNHLAGKVQSILPEGPLMRVSVRCHKGRKQKAFTVTAFITRTSAHEMSIEAGKSVLLTFKASAAHCIPR